MFDMKLTFKDVQYHRNGVGGTGFFCAVAHQEGMGDMLITYFPDIPGECCCAVFQINLLPNITFTENSWRGDRYAPAMKKACEEWVENRRKSYQENY